jgi:hypothetical protein
MFVTFIEIAEWPFYNGGWHLPKIALGIMAQVGMPVSGVVRQVVPSGDGNSSCREMSCLGWREVKIPLRACLQEIAH